ncbi:MAG: CDP-alcohol phosphatidyltransferase family protein [Candidatus Hermodarchaeota archaeon]
MTGFWNLPNLISLSRIGLLCLAIMFLYNLFNTTLNLYLKILAFIMIPVIHLLDGLDGIVARKFNQESEFGALFDIAIDRLVELAFLFCFVDLHLIPLWIPLIILARGIIVDMIRGYGASKGFVGWGDKSMIRSRVVGFIVNSRFFRSVIEIKAVAFMLFTLYLVLVDMIILNYKDIMGFSIILIQDIVWILAYVCLTTFVFINLARGLPYFFTVGKLIEQEKKKET